MMPVSQCQPKTGVSEQVATLQERTTKNLWETHQVASIKFVVFRYRRVRAAAWALLAQMQEYSGRL